MELDYVEGGVVPRLEPPSETTPPFTWLVFSTRIGSKTVWSWCKLTTGPGMDEVYYTDEDGVTPAELEAAPTKLGTFLFLVRSPR